MKIKLKTIFANEKISASIGEIITVDDETGKMLIDGGYAMPIKEIMVETAETKALETTEIKHSKKKGK